MKKYLKNKKGFTLIELIVVIAILGILAAIVVPRLSGFTDTAKQRAVQADARTIMTAYSAVVAANPGDTVTETEVTDLTGHLDGAISGLGGGDAVTFTYTANGYTVTVTDGVMGAVTKVTT